MVDILSIHWMRNPVTLIGRNVVQMTVMKRLRLLLTAVLSLCVSAVCSETIFYGGVNDSTAFLPLKFQRGWSSGMGYAGGFEQNITKDLSAGLDVNFSHFMPDVKYFARGGEYLISGDALSVLWTANLKAKLPQTKRRLVTPFVQAGAGLARLLFRPMDLFDIFQGTIRSYPGSSETMPAFKAGGGLIVKGPIGSILDVQFDAHATLLFGSNATSYGFARMLVLLKIPGL
jgi:hypothetical protein